MIDTLIIKYGTYGGFIENEIYEIKLDYSKCTQIVALEQGVLQEETEDFLKSIDGEIILMLYKGKSKSDNMDIFLISPVQIKRQIQLNKIL